MKIEFASDDLKRILTDQAHKMKLPFNVILAARRTLLKLEAAGSELDLMRIGGLDYKTLKGEKNGIKQVRINGQYRIQFILSDEDSSCITATITFIGDPH